MGSQQSELETSIRTNISFQIENLLDLRRIRILNSNSNRKRKSKNKNPHETAVNMKLE